MMLGCWSTPDPDGLTEAEWEVLRGMVLPSAPATRRDAGADPAVLAQLGQMLFFDRGLAGGAGPGVACVDCHDPRRYFSDSRVQRNVSYGLRWTARNSPPLLDLDLDSLYAWDGRGHTLEEQCRIAYLAGATMAGDAAHLAARIKAVPSYLSLYQLAFPDGGALDVDTWPQQRELLDNVASAWAVYLLRLRGGPSPFDRFVQDRFVQREAAALTSAQRRGLKLFLTTAGCNQCHRGPNFSDGEFHSVGIAQAGPNVGPDRGKADGFEFRLGPPYNPAGTKGPDAPGELVGVFRTPTLRNVASTGPYFHAGQLETLDEVVRFYNRGGDRAVARLPDGGVGQPDGFLVPLGLTDDEVDDLVAFLRGLTSPLPAEGLCNTAREVDDAGTELPYAGCRP
jgi:cytochrome c peroxidase